VRDDHLARPLRLGGDHLARLLRLRGDRLARFLCLRAHRVARLLPLSADTLLERPGHAGGVRPKPGDLTENAAEHVQDLLAPGGRGRVWRAALLARAAGQRRAQEAAESTPVVVDEIR